MKQKLTRYSSRLLLMVVIVMVACQVQGQSCMTGLMQAFNAQEPLVKMILYSGKGVNDLGDFDGCNAEEQLKYAMLRVTDYVTTNLYLGACIPSSCTDEELEIVSEGMSSLVADAGLFVEFAEVTPEVSPASGSQIALITVVVTVGLLVVLGEIINYTSLLNLREFNGVVGRPEDTKNVIGKILVSFSATRNIQKNFVVPKTKDDDYLTILNGIRVLSIFWVILGHGFLYTLIYPASNLDQITDFIHPMWIAIVTAGVFAVDVFFFMSAFLGTYLLISKPFDRSIGNFVTVYLHRIIRLLPTLALVTCCFMAFFIFLGSGPLWESTTNASVDFCKDQWWYNLLFINNVLPEKNPSGCIGWVWYLANDFQFFLLLPFQVMAFKRSRYLGYATCYYLLFGCIFCTYIITGIYHIGMSLLNDPNYGKYLYYKPWTRIGAYQVGVLFGMWYYEWMNRNKDERYAKSIGTFYFNCIKHSRVFRYICYIAGLALINFLIFYPHNDTRMLGTGEKYYSQAANNFYNSMSRPGFVFALTLVISGPLVGKNAFMRYVLGSNAYVPWARLTFMIYMIHILIFMLIYGQTRQATYLSYKPVFWTLFATILLSSLFAIPLSATLEAPFMQLEKLVLFPPKKKPIKAHEQRNVVEESKNDTEEILNERYQSKADKDTRHADHNGNQSTFEDSKLKFTGGFSHEKTLEE